MSGLMLISLICTLVCITQDHYRLHVVNKNRMALDAATYMVFLNERDYNHLTCVPKLI